MAADITDVARRAGVSIATVSRALRGLPDVAPATRDRVLAAARELNYAPSLFAAAIVHGRTATVAVVVSFLTRWFTGEVLAAVQAVLQPDRYDLLLYDVADPQQRAAFFAALPVRKRVDALLITAVPLSVSEADAVLRLRIPVGLIGAGRSGFHCARINDFAAARTAVEHLLGLGHRRIAFVGHRPHRPDPAHRLPASAARIRRRLTRRRDRARPGAGAAAAPSRCRSHGYTRWTSYQPASQPASQPADSGHSSSSRAAGCSSCPSSSWASPFGSSGAEPPETPRTTSSCHASSERQNSRCTDPIGLGWQIPPLVCPYASPVTARTGWRAGSDRSRSALPGCALGGCVAAGQSGVGECG